ncbi:MAG: hypothetical protein KA116_07340 [Proteobacteria bacterium]|nr:hypothetical protein [Pseudomonadota bacterium]
MKKIILLKGPGLLDYSEIAFLFESPDVSFETIEINAFSSEHPRFSDLKFDGLIFGSPYFFSPEEALWVRLLSKKIAPLLDNCWESNAKVLAMGRGALVFWEWMLADRWKNWKVFESAGVDDSLIECEFFIRGEWKALRCGRFSTDFILPDTNDFTDWESFLRNSGNTLGWVTRNCYITLVDLLAFMNSAQLESYGYSTDFEPGDFAGPIIEDIFELK